VPTPVFLGFRVNHQEGQERIEKILRTKNAALAQAFGLFYLLEIVTISDWRAIRTLSAILNDPPILGNHEVGYSGIYNKLHIIKILPSSGPFVDGSNVNLDFLLLQSG
jgi:hypothetical protein